MQLSFTGFQNRLEQARIHTHSHSHTYTHTARCDVHILLHNWCYSVLASVSTACDAASRTLLRVNPLRAPHAPTRQANSTQPRGGKKIHSEEEPSKNQTQVNKRCQQHELVLQHTPCLNVSERQWEKVAGLGAANGGSREDKKEWPSTLESVSQQALHNTPSYSTDQHF